LVLLRRIIFSFSAVPKKKGELSIYLAFKNLLERLCCYLKPIFIGKIF